MPVFLVPLYESNDCHNPAGPGGGQFCSTGGVAEALGKVRVVEEPRTPSPDHPEAHQHGDRVIVSHKFHQLTPEQRYHVLLHELGHWFRERFVPLADIMGWEQGDKFYDLFAAGNSEEGWAEAFAVFASHPQELKARYPTQFAALRALVTDDDVAQVQAFARKHSR
jgi:hypothetical protein